MNLGVQNSPRNSKPLSGNVDAGSNHQLRIHILREVLCEVLRRQGKRLVHGRRRTRYTRHLNGLHTDTAIVDRNLHSETGRILAVRNPLPVYQIRGRIHEGLNQLANRVLLPSLPKPLGTIANGQRHYGLLQLTKEVVHLPKLSCVLSCGGLCIRITPTHARRKRVRCARLLVVTNADSHRILRAGNGYLKILS